MMPFDSKNCTPSGKASEIVVDLASPGLGSCCKENININKSESSKLNIEPLQMKRKKKGGGHSLRKSLAWDRAFFTEEGVLDPLELSVITGAACRELPVIDEGTPGGSQLTTEPLVLQQLENYQLKVLRNEDLGDERRRECFSAKAHSYSSKIVASEKVSTHFGRKSVSRYGECPRPVPSSSLKRPATVNASKAAAKELKVPKIPGSVTGFSSTRATKSSTLRVNRLKHNQTTQPGSKISLKSLKNQTAMKPSSLRPTCHPEQNSGTSSVNRSANMSLQPGDNAYSSGSNNVAANMNSSRLLDSSENQNQSATFSAPSSQNAQSSGRIMHLSQNQNMKPSGLRMPSPSLSFFSRPKASVSNSLPSRDVDVDACGSQTPGNSRLQDKMMRTPKIVNNITESVNSSSTSMCPRSRCFMPSTANFVLNDALNIEKTCNKLAEDNKVVGGQTNGRFEKEGNGRIISLDFLKVGYEIPPQIDDCDLEIDGKNFQVANHGCTIESESLGSAWRNLETAAEENNEIHKSDAENAIDEPRDARNIFDVSISNYDADFGTHRDDETDSKVQISRMMQGGCKDTCKPDCCKPFLALTEEPKYPPSEIDKGSVETIERAIELVELQSSSCDEGAISEALDHRPANVRSSDFGSACQDEEADPTDVMADKLQAGEAHKQDPVFSLTIPDCKNKASLVSEVGDDIKESGKNWMIQDVCLRVELDSLRTDGNHTSDGLVSEKLTCFQKSHQEEIVETQIGSLSRNDGNKLNETKLDRHQTLVERHDCNFDEVEVIERTLTNTDLDFVDNSPSLIHKKFNPDGIYACKASYYAPDVPSREKMQSEVSVNGLGDDGNYLRNDESEKVLLRDPVNDNTSDVLYLDNRTMELDHCSSFPRTNDHDVSQNMYNEVTNTILVVKDDCQMNLEFSNLAPQKGGFYIDNQRNISDSRNMLVQPTERNMLNECCTERWEHLELPNRSEVEKISRTNDGLNIKNHLQNQRTLSDESLEDDSLGSMFATVAGSNVTQFGNVKNTSISANELSLKSECCNVSDGTDGQPYFADAITDPASIDLFLDSNPVEIQQETNNSIRELHPTSENDESKSALATNNNNGDDRNEKSHACIPPSTVPFSDEWLAAIEAEGEEILTRKGGAVQNSPPDKLLPEPSPWSPVKKKSNQTGPFDCTKFSNNLHRF